MFTYVGPKAGFSRQFTICRLNCLTGTYQYYNMINVHSIKFVQIKIRHERMQRGTEGRGACEPVAHLRHGGRAGALAAPRSPRRGFAPTFIIKKYYNDKNNNKIGTYCGDSFVD